MKMFESYRASFIGALWLIREKKYWIQGAYARDINGHDVYAHSDSAFCFCSSGAIRRNEGGCTLIEKFDEFLDEHLELENNKFSNIADYNDTHTYEEVIDLWVKVGVANDYLPSGFTMSQLESLRNSL